MERLESDVALMETAKESLRINKYIASCGVCSRRDADALITSGRVVINGTVATHGCKVGEGDTVLVDGKLISPNKTVVLAYHKPVGVTCSEKDVHADRLILDEIRYGDRVTYAGRLDKLSEGLIILTNDGDLIQNMMRGKNGHEKEYVVTVDKAVTAEFINALQQGIYLKELGVTTRECKAHKISSYVFGIILTQGFNRQIRRMCQTLGYEVIRLQRIRVMNISLDNLPVGEYRVVSGEELETLRKLACSR